MGIEGLGLLLGALGSGLGSIPEASLKTTMEMPEFESKILGNIKSQEDLKNFQSQAGVRSLETQAKTQELTERMPYTRQLVGADIANKLLAPQQTQAKIGLDEAQAAEHAMKSRTGGVQVVPDKWGGVKVIGTDPANPRTFGTDAAFGSLRNIPLENIDAEKIRSEISMHRAQIDHYKHLENVYGKLTPSDEAKLNEVIRNHKEMESIARLKQASDNKQATRLDAQYEINKTRLIAGFADDADKQIEAVRNGPLGKDKFAGVDPAVQHNLYEYMRNKILQGRVITYNSALDPDSPMRILVPVVPRQADLEALINAGVSDDWAITKWVKSLWGGGKKASATHRYNPDTGELEIIGND